MLRDVEGRQLLAFESARGGVYRDKSDYHFNKKQPPNMIGNLVSTCIKWLSCAAKWPSEITLGAYALHKGACT